LTSRYITYNELYNAIKIAFEEDHKVLELYDPNVIVNSIEDVSLNIFNKVSQIKHLCNYKGVYEKNVLIGYYIYSDMLLISFCLRTEYRTRNYLKAFFKLIKKDLGNKFLCRLWSRNIRAIKWLIKNKMEIVEDTNNITELVYLK
jgi:hypothetical protein